MTLYKSHLERSTLIITIKTTVKTTTPRMTRPRATKKLVFCRRVRHLAASLLWSRVTIGCVSVCVSVSATPESASSSISMSNGSKADSVRNIKMCESNDSFRKSCIDKNRLIL